MATDGNLPKCNFEEINTARNDPKILVIDVREIAELRETGLIPGSINIPLGDISVALGTETSNNVFRANYSAEKPDPDFNIIFTCRSGRRSGIAQQIALHLGYKNVKNYIGGWLDWEQHIKKL